MPYHSGVHSRLLNIVPSHHPIGSHWTAVVMVVAGGGGAVQKDCPPAVVPRNADLDAVELQVLVRGLILAAAVATAAAGCPPHGAVPTRAATTRAVGPETTYPVRHAIFVTELNARSL